MTLKKHDGKWSIKKILGLATLVTTVITGISLFPSAFAACQKGIAPWTSLPAKVEAIQESVAKIEYKLDIKNNVYTTNKAMAYGEH